MYINSSNDYTKVNYKMQLINVLVFVILVIVTVKCETKINVAKLNNDPMQILKAEIGNFKSQCEGSKEEVFDKRYSNIGSRGSFRSNKTSNKQFYDTSYGSPGRSGFGYGQDNSGSQDSYVPSSLSYDYRRYGRFGNDDHHDDDEECISRCIFGNLEVLDDNKSPSETALMKWFHDNAPQDDKRLKAIREIRRCFGSLASSDKSDGCAFSKSISNCLNLDIEK